MRLKCDAIFCVWNFFFLYLNEQKPKKTLLYGKHAAEKSETINKYKEMRKTSSGRRRREIIRSIKCDLTIKYSRKRTLSDTLEVCVCVTHMLNKRIFNSYITNKQKTN